MNEIERLIAQHPELDAHELESAYAAMDEDEDFQPRPYERDERHAHDIALAHLQHIGTEDWDGREGEQSDRSRKMLIEKAGVVTAQTDEGDQPAVLLPIGVFHNLMADLNQLAHMKASADGVGNAQDFWLQVVQRRLAQDAARRAWLADHGRDEV